MRVHNKFVVVSRKERKVKEEGEVFTSFIGKKVQSDRTVYFTVN